MLKKVGLGQLVRAVVAVAALVALAGCSIRTMAVNSVADVLSENGTTFSSDPDPELVRDAVPFALKLYESLLESVPEHEELLRATCSSFTQYAYAFVETEAERLEFDDFLQAQAIEDRAQGLYLRGRDYCLRALELRSEGVTRALTLDPSTALGWARAEDVPLLYWTGASWGAAIALGQDEPALVADVRVVRALFDRALALDETWERGTLHATMISLEGLPEAMGGSPARARDHFERAVELSDGTDPSPYVTFAASVSMPSQDREEFERLLDEALAIDPDANPDTRLVAIIAQDRARYLLSRVDDLFFSFDDEP